MADPDSWGEWAGEEPPAWEPPVDAGETEQAPVANAVRDAVKQAMEQPFDPQSYANQSSRKRGRPRAGRREKVTASPDLSDTRPVIQIRAGILDRLATEIEQALIAAGVPIYQRGASLVRPVQFEVPASRNQITISAGLSEMTQPAMIDLYAQTARWEKFDKRSEDWFPADPPANVAAVHLSRVGAWKLPPVAGIVTTPTLRPDGSVLVAAGYDPATRLYHVLDPALVLPPMSDSPTRAEAEEACVLLLDLIGRFPFVSNVSRSVALSMLITPIVRGALSVAPLHAVKASTAGTGKSFLVDLASAISTGRPCPVAAAAATMEETEKRLVGLLLAAFPIVSIDNVNGELGGDLLCQAVERPLIRVRPLGRSDILEIESRAVVFATGNGLRVTGDMVRRTLLALLDANMERPELREFDRNPVAEVLADRGRYVAACLTIVRAYANAGRPGRLPPLASFEDWSDLVRSALVWLGQEDPCASMETAREDDPELAELRMVVTAWHEAFGSVPTTVRKAIEAATATVGQADENGDVPTHNPTMVAANPDLRDALLLLAGVRGVIDASRVGMWLAGRRDRIVSTPSLPNGARFAKDGETASQTRWRLTAVVR
ncbi:MAG: hypothetical protein ACRYG8_08970 [Janthinobacterium lividum]